VGWQITANQRGSKKNTGEVFSTPLSKKSKGER
jgi:hypothetical protein